MRCIGTVGRSGFGIALLLGADLLSREVLKVAA
jgi:hypothetical protein